MRFNLFLLIVFFLSACDQMSQNTQEILGSVNPQSNASIGLTDINNKFIAKNKPLLDEKAVVEVLLATNKKFKPKFLVEKELGFVSNIIFAKDGSVFFLSNMVDQEAESTSIDYIKQTSINVISETGDYSLITEAGVFDVVTTDEGNDQTLYSSFDNLNILPDGNLFVRKDDLPYKVDVKTGKQSLIPYKTSSGKLIESIADDSKQDFFFCEVDENGLIFNYDNNHGGWTHFYPGEQLKLVDDLNSLPNQSYIYAIFMDKIRKNKPVDLDAQFYTLGPDGYIYYIALGNPPYNVIPKRGRGTPDRLVRIGDVGQSSLREGASRVVIAEFNQGELSGSLAFNAKGELAIGAKNAIYLIPPIANDKNG